jgi:hypothetical protein
MLYAFIKSTVLAFLFVIIFVEVGAWHDELTLLEEAAALTAELAAKKGATPEVIEAARVAALAYNEGPSFPTNYPTVDLDFDFSDEESTEEKDQKSPEDEVKPENLRSWEKPEEYYGTIFEEIAELFKEKKKEESFWIVDGTDSENEASSESSSDQLPPFVEDANANLRDFNDVD